MCPIFSERCFWDWVSEPRHKIGVVSHRANQRQQRQTWPWCLDRGFKFWQDTQSTSYSLVILNYLMQFGDVWGGDYQWLLHGLRCQISQAIQLQKQLNAKLQVRCDWLRARHYPPISKHDKHGNGNSPIISCIYIKWENNLSINAGLFHCHAWLPEGPIRFVLVWLVLGDVWPSIAIKSLEVQYSHPTNKIQQISFVSIFNHNYCSYNML